MNAKPELEQIRERWLIGLQAHDILQNERDAEARRSLAEEMRKRYPPESLRVRESSSGYSVPAYAFRELTAEEVAERERPRSRTRGPAPEIKPDPPSLRFTAGEVRGAFQSLDVMIIEAVEKGIPSIYQIETRKPEDVFNCAWSLTHDSMNKPNGNTASCYIDSGLKNAAGSRIFVELTGQAEGDPGALILGELRAIPDDALPIGLPSNTDTVAYAEEQLRKEREEWARKHAPSSPEDLKRAREEAAEKARTDAAVAAALKTAGADIYGRPRNVPQNPQVAAL